MVFHSVLTSTGCAQRLSGHVGPFPLKPTNPLLRLIDYFSIFLFTFYF